MTEITGSTSDGFHTFDELYHHRTMLFLLLQQHLEAYHCPVWKSRLHEDGTIFPGFFIAGVETAQGQATYHCLDRYWDLFEVPELGRAPAFDGHTPDDTLARLFAAMTGGQKLDVKP